MWSKARSISDRPPMADDDPWPTELKVDKDRASLTVSFDDGADFTLPAELLRVMSPSAEVQGHSPEERVTVPGKNAVGIVGSSRSATMPRVSSSTTVTTPDFSSGPICASSARTGRRAGELSRRTRRQGPFALSLRAQRLLRFWPVPLTPSSLHNTLPATAGGSDISSLLHKNPPATAGGSDISSLL